MDPSDAEATGRALADRHARPAEPAPDAVLLNYAERSRIGDWTMRSALTRFAQPEAVRSGQVFELVRRLDAVLGHLARPLEGHTVVCDRQLGAQTVAAAPGEPYPDTRTADLARIANDDPDGFDAVLDAYVGASGVPLDEAEQAALPLLRVALHLDDLAEELARWANRGPQDPPVTAVDRACSLVRALLDELGVPVEQGPPPGRRGRRG